MQINHQSYFLILNCTFKQSSVRVSEVRVTLVRVSVGGGVGSIGNFLKFFIKSIEIRKKWN